MTDTPLAGQLEDTSFAEVAGLLFRGSKTGILTVTSPKKERKVVFYQGHPVAVLSSDPREHIARFLAVKNKISREQAEELLKGPETKEALQSSGILTKELLTWGMKFRFINLAYDLFRWTEGSYTFEEQPPPRDYFLMKVPAPSLLIKGTKHMPPSLLMEKIPGSFQVGPGSVSTEEIGALGDEETAFLRDCREGRLVREILEDNTVEIPRARELLFAFLSLGLVSLEEPSDLNLAGAGSEMEGVVLDSDEAPGEEGLGAVAFELEGDAARGEPEAAAGEPAGFEAEPFRPEEPQEAFGDEAPAEDTAGFGEARGEEQPAAFGDESPAEAGTALELESQGETVDETPPQDTPPLELELEPTSAAPLDEPSEGESPALEIERHSYGDEPASSETPGGDEEAGAPSLELDEPKPLDEPAPLGLEEGPPGLEPPPLEAPAPEGDLPPLDGGEHAPGEDLPREDTPGLPPPPWQEQESADEAPPGDRGVSPFTPQGEEGAPRPARREKPAAEPPKEKKSSGPLSKAITVIALVAAAAVVGTGIWVGWKSLRSPSTPLDPIPEAESVTGTEMAEGLPVPALPTSVKKAMKKQEKSEPSPEQKAPATKAAPSAPPASLSGESGFYRQGYALFSNGDLAGAASAWLGGLEKAGFSHTVQVEVACQPDTVRNDVERFGRDRQVFAVPLTLKGRPCYRVLMGAFRSEADAAAALDGLPSSLKKGLSVRSLQGII